MKIILLFSLIVLSIPDSLAQDILFTQYFTAGGVPDDYVDATTPGNTKFTEIAVTTGTNATPSIAIVNGAIELSRLNADIGGGQCRLVRSINLSPDARSLYVQFKVDISVGNPATWAPGTGIAFLSIGDGTSFNNGGATPTNAETFGKLFFSTSGTNQSVNWTLAKRVGSTTTNATVLFQAQHQITWVLNNTGYRVTYVKPAGASAPATTTVATGTWDVWVDGTPVFTAVPATTAGIDLRKFKFIFDGGIGTARLDDFLLQDVSGVLPVRLTDFRAVANEGRVELYWQLPTPAPGSILAVERSRNGYDYAEISRQSTDPEQRYFAATDTEPFTGLSYYRLRHVTNDGALTLSAPISVQVRGGVAGFSIRNNPSTGERIALITNELTNATYQLITLAGQPVSCQTSETPDGQVTLLPQHPLPSGVYVLTATTGAIRLTRRLLVY